MDEWEWEWEKTKPFIIVAHHKSFGLLQLKYRSNLSLVAIKITSNEEEYAIASTAAISHSITGPSHTHTHPHTHNHHVTESKIHKSRNHIVIHLRRMYTLRIHTRSEFLSLLSVSQGIGYSLVKCFRLSINVRPFIKNKQAFTVITAHFQCKRATPKIL